MKFRILLLSMQYKGYRLEYIFNFTFVEYTINTCEARESRNVFGPNRSSRRGNVGSSSRVFVLFAIDHSEGL